MTDFGDGVDIGCNCDSFTSSPVSKSSSVETEANELDDVDLLLAEPVTPNMRQPARKRHTDFKVVFSVKNLKLTD